MGLFGFHSYWTPSHCAALLGWGSVIAPPALWYMFLKVSLGSLFCTLLSSSFSVAVFNLLFGNQCLSVQSVVWEGMNCHNHWVVHVGAGIARWQCVGLAVMLDVPLWVRSSSEENFPSRGDFSLRVNMGSDSIHQKLLEYKLRSSLCTHVFHHM